MYRWEDFEFLPGVVEAMRRFSSAGYKLIVATNQSGIARGFFSESDYHRLTEQLENHLARHGVRLTKSYFCPHYPNGVVKEYAIRCGCRKPEPGLLLQAKKEFGLDMPNSILIGDKASDTEAAAAAGVGRAYLLVAERDSEDDRDSMVHVVQSLSECADRLGLPK